MNIEEKLTTSIISAIKTLYGQDVPGKMVQLQKTKKEFEGHLTLVVFPFLKMSKKGPEQTAQEIGGYLKEHAPELVSAYNAVKGFLNLTIASDCWIELLNSIQAAPEYGIEKATENSPLVMIEYSSPNTNKPLHLGHVRNNLLGNALANVMAANGNKVVKTNIVNDRGIHICKSMLAWLKYGNGETPESSGKKGDHLIGDYYVAFDKHYKAEVKELTAQYQAEGLNEEEAKAKAEANSPLMLEAREMLRKWEANDPEIRALWKKMNGQYIYYTSYLSPVLKSSMPVSDASSGWHGGQTWQRLLHRSLPHPPHKTHQFSVPRSMRSAYWDSSNPHLLQLHGYAIFQNLPCQGSQ